MSFAHFEVILESVIVDIVIRTEEKWLHLVTCTVTPVSIVVSLATVLMFVVVKDMLFSFTVY